jgi:hypothetical protein
MRNLALPSVLLAIVAGTLTVQTAHADIYTWTDKAGMVNVSNLPPPEGARVTRITREAPKDPAREAAREAARQADIRALSERVAQLSAELEQSRREAPPPMAFMPPPVMAYASPPQSAPYIVNVVSPPAPAYAPAGGCDYGWGDCGFGVWPGYYPASVFVTPRGKGLRRGNSTYQYGGQIVPPLITPLPQLRPMAAWHNHNR